MLNSLSENDHDRLSRLAAIGVSAAAAALCLYLAVRILWLLVPRADAPVVESASPGPAAPAPVSIAKWHLFGNAQALPVAGAPALATVLKLGLRGTLALPDPKDARAIAIIANEQGVESSFRIGAEVAPHARLAEIYPERVVLDHAGSAETLTLPRPEQHAVTLADASRVGAAPPVSNVPFGIHPGPPAAPSAGPRLDPQDFVRQIRPVMADGRIVGADISGADPGLLARVGLQPSDVVTAINGTPLTQVSDPQALIAQLQSSASIQVTVQRDGKPATLTLSLR